MSPTYCAPTPCPLVVCPTVYCGAGDEEYVVTLGSLLNGHVDLFWTGRAICSPAITAAEAVAFTTVRCACRCIGTTTRSTMWR